MDRGPIQIQNKPGQTRVRAESSALTYGTDQLLDTEAEQPSLELVTRGARIIFSHKK